MEFELFSRTNVSRPDTPVTNYRFAPAGIKKPRVIKSPSFLAAPCSENRDLRLSFPPSLRRFCFCFSSSSTFAVREAVAAFLMAPLDARIPSLGSIICGPEGFSAPVWTGAGVGTRAVTVSTFFFRFFPDDGAFFNECVRPRSFRL